MSASMPLSPRLTLHAWTLLTQCEIREDMSSTPGLPFRVYDMLQPISDMLLTQWRKSEFGAP